MTGLVVGLSLLLSAPATWAQSLSLGTITNSSSANEVSSSGGISYQRSNTISSTTTPPMSFSVHYSDVVGTDTETTASATEVLDSDYTINFTATAPGAYDLTVSSSLVGAFTLVDDGTIDAHADITSVTGNQTGGTVSSGNLSLADP
ncbi:MAG: hypothetical protein HY270_13025 [Deltaproteobacteria bacterium]|nr:hypothetical protein [Deltaproteobacteria bacterium]